MSDYLHSVLYDERFGSVERRWARRNVDDDTWSVLGFYGEPEHIGLSEDIARQALAHSPATDIATPRLGPGEYHPRVWRRHYFPNPMTTHRREWMSSARAAEILFSEMTDVFRVVEPSPANFDAYGHRLRELLILTCTEVETACKAVLQANGMARERFATNDYVRLRDPMRLAEWRVALAVHPDVPELQPFGQWDPAKPTESLRWYDAYNVSHRPRASRGGFQTS